MVLRLREYPLLRGEKRGLEVIHPGQRVCDSPRRRFMARHGLDPMALDNAATAVLSAAPRDGPDA